MPNLETRPGKITIPGRPETVDVSRIRGSRGRIEYELMGDETYIGNSPQARAIKDALERGERAFLTGSDEIMFLGPAVEGQETGEAIVIPGRPVEVDTIQAQGDFTSGIKSEIGMQNKWYLGIDGGQEIENVLNNGGRVFITEDDSLLFVNPPFTS